MAMEHLYFTVARCENCCSPLFSSFFFSTLWREHRKMADIKTPAVTDTALVESPAASAIVPNEFHDGTDAGKKAFLSTFTAEEDKAIMRKVDRKFLLLIGIIYLFKNVSKNFSRQNNAY